MTNDPVTTSAATRTLPPGWEPVEQYPPTFPECGACYGLMTVLSGEGGAPYGYCPACESYTTWALVSRNREEAKGV